MLRHGDTFREAGEFVSNDNAAKQHRIRLAKSDLLITLPEIPGGAPVMTVISTVMHPSEPIFTRESA